MKYENLLVERSKSGVLTVTLNRPESLNALGMEMSRELKTVLTEAESDPEVRVTVIRGAGRAFSSGGNVKEMRDSLDQDPGRYMDELTAEVYAAIEMLMQADKPLIAQVHGLAYGAAFNLVMACDLAVASSDAVFCESFTRLGLIPGGHATTLLTRALGMKRALEICLTAREVPAAEALALGLVSQVVEPDQLETETQALAEKIAAGPPLALRETKRLIRGYYLNPPGGQARLERETQVRMGQSADYAEGIRAFFDKRKPEFKGK